MSKILQFKALLGEVLRSKQITTLVSYRVSPFQSLVSNRVSSFHSCGILHNDQPVQTSDPKPEVDSSSSGGFNEEYTPREASSVESSENVTRASEESSIIQRLRRLSMTDAHEYELSPVAQEKARQMSKARAEVIERGEQWKWDQRNVRPGGAPPPPRQYGGYNRRDSGYGRRQYDDNYDDDNGGGDWRRSYGDRGRRQYDDNHDDDNGGGDWRRSYGDRGRRNMGRQQDFRDDYNEDFYEDNPRRQRNNRPQDDYANASQVPDNYELEMQKLRERLQKNKAARNAVGEGTERKNLIQASTTHLDPVGIVSSTEIAPHTEKFQLDSNSQGGSYSSDYEVNLKLAADDPDSFGNLNFTSAPLLVKDHISEEIRKELLEDEKALAEMEDEEDDSRFLLPAGERWSTHKLIRTVRGLLKEKKLKEAVDTYLSVLKQGGFQFEDDPLRHHFNVLINECADVGYVDMAFRLYNLMKKRGYKEKLRSITSLLNACANSPWDKEKNLDRIEKLLINMKDRGLEPNLTNYHALIKAYGRLGETLRAFNVVDTMIKEAKIKPVTATFNMLLQACITDTQNGFRYTLITWRKMLSKKKIRPDIYSYNLLLRAIRDCGIELHENEIQALKEGSQGTTTTQLNSSEVLMLPPVISENDSNKILSFLIPEKYAGNDAKVVLDNLGEPAIVDVKSFVKALTYPTNRMAVLGGIRGILSQMVRHKVAPNLKTLTAMLQVSRATDINDVLQLLQAYKIKPDVCFFNLAIRQCVQVRAHKPAEYVLKMMNTEYNISPDIHTWIELAGGCQSWFEAKKLMEEMESAKFNPDTRFMYKMLLAAIRICDPQFVVHVMDEVRNRQIPIEQNFLLTVDTFIAHVQKGIVSHEMGKQVESKRLAEALERNRKLGEHFGILKMRYSSWINQVDVKIAPENPWKHDWQYFNEHKRHKPRESEDAEYETIINAALNS